MGSIETFASLDHFSAYLRQYEEDTKTKFIVLKSDRSFGKSDQTVEKQLNWEVKTVPFNGIPFKVIGKKTYICHQGRDKHAKAKQRREETKAQCLKEDHSSVKTRRLMQPTKKMGCPATIYVSHIVKFPDYLITEDNPNQKRDKSSALREALKKDPSQVRSEEMFAACFPNIKDHQNHPIAVKATTDILNIIQKIKTGNRTSSTDHLNLQALVNKWNEEGYAIEYRPAQEKGGTMSKLLLCMQMPWQRRLMLLYGQQICLLDATYRTSRYSVPLFFLWVRTNVNYAVVGVFITQTDTKEDIADALKVFQNWNSDWNPSHFMVDFREAEIGALEEVFKGSKVLLSDFHREKEWVEWTRIKDNDVTCQKEVLTLLRAIADAQTKEEFQNSTVTLKQHPVWQTNEKLRRWFSSKWLSQAERWLKVFKNENLKLVLYTNNGVERQNEALKHSYLEGYRNCSLSETLIVIVRDLLPRSYQKYVELNVKCSSGYRKYSANVPCYLRDRPRMIAQHIMARHQESLLFNISDITSADKAVFNVKSQTSQEEYQVNFGSDEQMPSCTCLDWQENLLPCQHFCAVLNLVPGWNWENLSSMYRQNPFFTLDEVCLGHSGTLPVTSSADLHLARQRAEVLKKKRNKKTPEKGSSTQPPALPSGTILTTPSFQAQKLQKCGSLLREITDLTSHLQDETFLDSVIDRLTDLLEDVRHHTPHNDTLDLSYTPPSKKWCSVSTRHPNPLSTVPKTLC
ncbi:uncharacterized protein si:dkey-31c13.1 isoform X1 [Myxocyprinus asiaticus]|uniref:uncharacterized protein si:dkey-31c13.1 isoform X1 n=1 Tax=Myxocyprinus asiaticus TaxID=70543 RepID=UPI002221EE79|nr:uncharacterized protein si:dkey-31c13.1 isoform X1 [Myxocyprinus asiaticus]